MSARTDLTPNTTLRMAATTQLTSTSATTSFTPGTKSPFRSTPSTQISNDPTFESSQDRPIQRVKNHCLDRFEENLLEHGHVKNKKDAHALAIQHELVLRLQRWARYHGHRLNDKFLVKCTNERLNLTASRFESLLVRTGKKLKGDEIYGVILDCALSPDQVKETHNIAGRCRAQIDTYIMNHEFVLPFIYVNVKRAHRLVPAVKDLPVKATEQHLLLDLSIKWWNHWAFREPALNESFNPFNALLDNINNGEFSAYTDAQFIQMLANRAVNNKPAFAHLDVRRTGWPGYARFREQVETMATRLVGPLGKTIRSKAVQENPVICEGARAMCPDIVWYHAFQVDGECPNTAEEIISGIERLTASGELPASRLKEIFHVKSMQAFKTEVPHNPSLPTSWRQPDTQAALRRGYYGLRTRHDPSGHVKVGKQLQLGTGNPSDVDDIGDDDDDRDGRAGPYTGPLGNRLPRGWAPECSHVMRTSYDITKPWPVLSVSIPHTNARANARAHRVPKKAKRRQGY